MIVKIKDKKIKEDTPFIIAEAGINHNGNIDLAMEMIRQAKLIGADAIKFQTYKTENLLIKNKKTKELFNELKKYELSYDDFRKLILFAKKQGIIFLSTPDDIESFKFLYSMKIPSFKIGSGEIDNYYFLKMIAKANRTIILSLGTANDEEVYKAYKAIYSINKKLILMHCISAYPAPIEHLNLKHIAVLKKKYRVNIGFSDHSTSLLAPAIAVSMGASVIEKHFTLDNGLNGPDHKMSLNPENFLIMINNIKDILLMLGTGKKPIIRQEEIIKKEIRKSIYTNSEIKEGDTLSINNTVLLRPQMGLTAAKYEYFAGKKFKKNKNAYKPIRAEDLT